jgi:uncharacterized protein with von Willebrand factor type A (vWA) domain
LSGFDSVLLELIDVVRRSGVRISPAESMDAMRAAAAIGVADREDLRAALAASLVKRTEDLPIFDRAFDAFVRREKPLDPGLAKMREAGVSDALIERALAMQGASGAGGGIALLMAGGAELEQAVQAALDGAGIAQIQSTMQVGLFTLRTLERLGADAAQRDLDRLRAELGDEGAVLADALARELEALRRYVRARVRAEVERQSPDRLERSRAERLERSALAALTKDEVEQVTREVRRLGRTLRDRMERERRRARRGRLDVRATVRASLRSGGVPVRPVFRRRRRDRPKLVVICDVSDSVRAAARFLLVLVYAMQEAFARARSFVFVREIGESTPLFDRHDATEAVGRAFAGEVVSVAANSDYGHMLGQLRARHLDAFDRKTTLVVLGDARSNYLDPNVDALAALHRRVARIVWLNPEPRASWGFGDSEMNRYLPWCTLAAPVRSLSELREAVERLATIVTR